MKKEVLRVATAGSVDDGKSTLIGRLLHGTNSLSKDKLEAIDKVSKLNGLDYPDLALVTDGLLAERDQGITIDVAHVYFATTTRNYILADSPGHFEYTRNMVTGASNAELSIILIDVRNGITEQTMRHIYINKLLGVKRLIFAVNKMDLVDYDQTTFQNLKNQIIEVVNDIGLLSGSWQIIPISALRGDLIVARGDKMPWFTGPTILESLEKTKVDQNGELEPTRFIVQNTIRTNLKDQGNYRGFAGKLAGGILEKGDQVTILPSMSQTTIDEIQFFRKSFTRIKSGASCTLCLEDKVDVSRGSVIVKSDDVPELSRDIQATVCWMDEIPWDRRRKYYLKQGVSVVQAQITAVSFKYNQRFDKEENPDNTFLLNEIGIANIHLASPIINEDFNHQRATGRFILIDAELNNTVALGFINR